MQDVRDSLASYPRHGSRIAWWYCFCNCSYHYGRVVSPPNKLPPYLAVLNEIVAIIFRQDLNSINLNFYVGGTAHLGYHSDDENILDHRCIVSLSVGEARKFVIKNKISNVEIPITIGSGDIVTMEGNMQRHYLHGAPPVKKGGGHRFNLTVRKLRYCTCGTTPMQRAHQQIYHSGHDAGDKILFASTTA